MLAVICCALFVNVRAVIKLKTGNVSDCNVVFCDVLTHYLSFICLIIRRWSENKFRNAVLSNMQVTGLFYVNCVCVFVAGILRTAGGGSHGCISPILCGTSTPGLDNLGLWTPTPTAALKTWTPNSRPKIRL